MIGLFGSSPPAPYPTSAAHLADELHRAAGLVRAQLLRFEHAWPEAQREKYWHLTDDILQELAGDTDRSPVAEFDPDSETARILAWADARRTEIDRHVGASEPGLLRLDVLRGEFALEAGEVDLLLLALLAQIHSRFRWLYGVLQHDAARVMPTAGFLAELCARSVDDYAAALGFLARTSSLVSDGLLDVAGNEEEPLVLRAVSVENRIAAFLQGDDRLDARLEHVASWSTPVGDLRALPIAPEILNRLEMLPHLRAAEPDFVGRLRLQFSGPDGALAVRAFTWIAQELELPLLTVDVAGMLSASLPLEQQVDLALREARLAGSAVMFVGAEALFAEEHSEKLAHLMRRLAVFPRPAALEVGSAASPDGLTVGTAFIPFLLARPTLDMRRKLWLARLAKDADRLGDIQEIASDLATAFQLTDAQIREAERAARVLARRRNVFLAPLERADLFAACRALSSRQLVAFAQRIEPDPKLTLDDVVLPPLNKRPLIELRERIRNNAEMPHVMGLRHPTRQGRGVLALFVGGSGTGKTLAAEALASGQHVDFFRVELSALVSKYVGDTEKNLAKIFSDAERTNCMLFFDEADSMFGKRGDVKEARDRWANMEVNWLLQAVERHPGVVILATNFRQSIDEAFLRRIHVIVDFPAPDAESRRRIWANLLPAPEHHAVTDDELHQLADRFNLTGGNIRNVVVDGCFRAMQAPDRRLTARHLVAGVVREYQKLVRPTTIGEFGPQFYQWAMEDVLAPQRVRTEAGAA
jgi:hypothetical protein